MLLFTRSSGQISVSVTIDRPWLHSDFDINKEYIYKTQILIAESMLIRDMYAFSAKTTLDCISAVKYTPSNVLSPKQLLISWHRTFVHANFDDIKRLKHVVKLKPTTASIQCETCVIFKCTRLSFGEPRNPPN